MSVHIKDTILLVDKPKGITSFDVIRILRRKLGIRKMGHAGTLDPRASGLMLVGINAGTKKLTALIGLSKVYEATICLGVSTDTDDLDGVVSAEEKAQCTDEEIKSAVKAVVGELELKVPTYAAIKQGGVPLYKKARNGEVVDAPLRKMKVFSAELKNIKTHEDRQYVEVVFEVASGVYIRSLAVELGRLLGVPATLAELRRTSIGEFRIEGAMKIDERNV